MVHLKVLQLEGFKLDKTTATSIAQKLHNLENVHYFCYERIQVSEGIVPFVRYSTKLTEMAITCAKIIDDNVYKAIRTLNKERRKLVFANKLIILIHENSDKNWVKLLNGVDKGLVNVKNADYRLIHDKFESENPLTF